MHQPVFAERVHAPGLGLARLEKPQRLGDRHLIDQHLAGMQRGFRNPVPGLDHGSVRRAGGGSRRRRSWRRISGSKSHWWCRRSPDRSPSARRRGRGSRRSPARRRCPSHRASASRGWRTAPDSRGIAIAFRIARGSSAWSVHRDRRSYKLARSFRGLLHRRRLVRFGEFLAQFAQQAEFGLEIDVMRQF